MATGKELLRQTGTSRIWCAALAPGSKKALTGGTERTLRVWEWGK